jgi:hypothetical protein
MCRLLFLLTFFFGCHTSQNNIDSSNQATKKTEISLDNYYKLIIVTKGSLVNQHSIVQKLTFWKDNNQINEINLNNFKFIKSANPFVNAVARIEIGNKLFYLLYISMANGEPEYYIISSPNGELIAYEQCRKDKCETVLTQRNLLEKEILDFLQNDSIEIKYKDVF